MRWTPKDDAALRRMAEANYTVEQMGALLNRTAGAVYGRSLKLGIQLARRPVPNHKRRGPKPRC